MRRIVSIAALVLSASLASGVAPAAPEVGEPAPAFALRGSDGEDYALSQFVGKEAVVLAWFPKAFTPGWTQELEALRDSASDLAGFEASVFMVSLDSPEKNRDFAKSLEADLVLLSDPTGDAAEAYGVKGFGGFFARRWTFYIDRDGIVRHVDRDVNTATAGQDIAIRLEKLDVPRRSAPPPEAVSDPAPAPPAAAP